MKEEKPKAVVFECPNCKGKASCPIDYDDRDQPHLGCFQPEVIWGHRNCDMWDLAIAAKREISKLSRVKVTIFKEG
jgi:hypothetical protein